MSSQDSATPFACEGLPIASSVAFPDHEEHAQCPPAVLLAIAPATNADEFTLTDRTEHEAEIAAITNGVLMVKKANVQKDILDHLVT